MKRVLLDFDWSDGGDGVQTLDALASVWPCHWPELLNEARLVLDWARQQFGEPAPAEEGGEWDADVQAWVESNPPRVIPLEVWWATGRCSGVESLDATVRCTLSLSISVNSSYAAAFTQLLVDAD